MIFYSIIILGWLNCCKNIIYLYVRWASVEFWNASKFFFNAWIVFFCLSITFQTCPYAPLPIFFIGSNRAKICFSIYSLIFLYIFIYYTKQLNINFTVLINHFRWLKFIPIQILFQIYKMKIKQSTTNLDRHIASSFLNMTIVHEVPTRPL